MLASRRRIASIFFEFNHLFYKLKMLFFTKYVENCDEIFNEGRKNLELNHIIRIPQVKMKYLQEANKAKVF